MIEKNDSQNSAPGTNLGNHDQAKRKLRKAGWICSSVGLVIMVLGLILLIYSVIMESYGAFFFLFAVIPGFLLLDLGVIFLFFGYMGAINRFMMSQSVPVTKDATNDMLHGTREETAKTVGAVVTEIRKEDKARFCPKCQTANESDAQFCKACGAPLLKTCSKCGQPNDADSVFCSKCGTPLP